MKLFCRFLERTPLVRTTLGAAALGLFLAVAPVQAQTGTVEGRVTATGTDRPIVRAQVAVVGTNLGATTDREGRYVILNVPAGRVELRTAAIGYTIGTLSMVVQPGAMATGDFSLSASVLRLDEVVVTGTAGQARRREIGNTIAQINVADLKDPPQSVETLLQARSAGVTVMQASGMAGSGAQIRLRGAVSVSQGNQPLLYVDGVRVRSDGYRRNRPPVGFTGRSGNVEASPLNDINPNDIERIEIIKGAAASTLYGTEAAAGVIQIFTKRGSQGAPRWTVQMDQGAAVTQPFGTTENPYLNLRPCNTGTSCWSGWSSNTSVGQCGENGSGPAGSNEVDVHCSWLRTAPRGKYAASVAGGTGPFQYFLSGTYSDFDATLPNDNQKTLNTRGNFSFDVANNVRVDVNTSFTNNDISNTAAGNNAHGVTLNVFRAERNYFGDSDPNNLRQLLNQEITTELNHLISGATVNYNPVSWFTNRMTVGYDLAAQENRNLRPFGFVRATGGILSDEQIRYTTLTADYVGSLNLGLSDNIRTTVSFGGQSTTGEVVRTTAYGQDFPGPGVPTVSSGSLYQAREDRVRTINAGFFFQNLLAISDKYFLTTGVRFDGHSAFGSNLGIKAYPKGQLSYVISDEDFFPEGMGEMKLRGAFGFSGRAPDAFDAIRTWSPLPVDNSPGFTPGNVGNLDVGPERTREIELGFDWAFLDNKISTEFTYYTQRTTDALFGVRQIPSGGFQSSRPTNIGTMDNKGLELSINATLIDNADFGLDIGSNFYTNKSTILSLGGAPAFGAGGGWIQEGQPAFVVTGVRFINRDGIVSGPLTAADTLCGPTCLDNNEFPYGPPQPTFVWTPSVSLRLPKGINLSARGELQTGAFITMGQASAALSRSVQHPLCSNAHAILANDPTGGGMLTAWETHACIPANHDGDIHVYKQDFFKVRDLTAQVPLDFVLPSTFDSAMLTITFQNWFRSLLDSKLDPSRAAGGVPGLLMFDPEMVGRGSVNDNNRSIAEHIPPPAVFTASIRVTF